ncbi:MAG TPA: isochorismatase family cysteine hydrolase [Candidatus Binatia bacterium]|jgi:ureidoacrylate peracid hydrolase
MVEFPVSAGECALLIHDIGEGLRTPGKRLYDPTGPSVIATVAKLADFCRTKNLPFFYAVVGDYRPPPGVVTRYNTMAAMDDETRKIPPEIAPRDGDTVFVKYKSGAFIDTPVEAKMRALGKNTLIVCGSTLQYGIETACRDAANRDFRVLLVADCVRVREIKDCGWGHVTPDEIRKVVFSALSQVYAKVVTLEQLKDLLG